MQNPAEFSPSSERSGGYTVVVFSDVHLDRRFAWCRPDAARRRRHNIRQSLIKIVDVAERVNADAVFCAGDLYEDALYTPDCANFVAELFAMDRPVLIAPGNHDYFSASSMYARQQWPSNVTIFDSDRFTPIELVDGLRVWGAAHRAPQSTPSFFESFGRVDGAGVNLALFHGSEQTGFPFEDENKAPHAPFSDRDVAAAGFDYAFVGHYHRHSVAEHHCYPGTPDPLEFSEDTHGGVVIAQVLPSGKITIATDHVATTSCHSVEVDVSEATSTTAIAHRVRDEVAALSGYLRVDLVGEVAPELLSSDDELTACIDPLLEDSFEDWVVRTSALRARFDLEAIAEETSVRGAFVSQLLDDSNYDDETRQQIIEVGLRAFAGRSDLEVV